MQRLLAGLVSVLAACGFQHGALVDALPGGGDDGGGDDATDAMMVDARVCEQMSITCVNNDTAVEFCGGPGATALIKNCNWGCLPMSSTQAPHCGQLIPSADAVTTNELMTFTNLGDVTLTAGLIINGSTGEVGTMSMPGTLHTAMAGTQNGIEYSVTASGAAVFRFKKLTISGNIQLTGSRPMVLIADDAISISAVVDARGSCTNLGNTIGGTAGPGGFMGGPKYMSGNGPGGGGPGTSGNPDEGGGGGGAGGTGGRGGGPGGAVGVPYDLPVTMLVGGSGGGGSGGGGGNSQSGGGGGGAVQIISNRKIDISAGGINAGGCGGFSTTGPDAGGGGGAGGTIVLEAPAVVISGTIAVNGGGGGAGAVPVLGQGENGRLDATPAAGAASNGGAGGNGAAGSTLDGVAGAVAGGKAGGGGGAVGRIHITTRNGTQLDVKTGAIVSPPVGSAAATHTAATTQ